MIIYKDNKLSVEENNNYSFDGVHLGVIISVQQIQQYNEVAFSCYIYIPGIYGQYIINQNYPRVIIPLKVDLDDEGTIPEIGDVVKVSFDDGDPNSCRFISLQKVNTEVRAINKLYLEKNVSSTNIIYTYDDALLDKVKQWLSDAYFVTLGKTEPALTDFSKYGYLVNNLKSDEYSFINYYISPLNVPLKTYINTGFNFSERVPIFLDLNGYTLDNIIKLFNDSENYTSKEFQDFIENLDLKYPDGQSLFSLYKIKNIEDKIVLFTLSLLCISNSDYVQYIFPNYNNATINNILDHGAVYLTSPFLWLTDANRDAYASFIYNISKKYYEKVWASACVGWESGVNNLLRDISEFTNIDEKYKTICLCLTIIPWMAKILFAYNLNIDSLIVSESKVQETVNEISKYDNIFDASFKDFSKFNTLVTNEIDYKNIREELINALNIKNNKAFIQTFQKIAKQLFCGTKITDNEKSWKLFNFDDKFKRLQTIIK